jgi:O-antigen ligase
MYSLIKDSSLNTLDQLIWWNIIALILFLIFSVAAGQALAILLVLLFIIKSVKQKKIGIQKNPLVIPYLIFIASRILAVIFSEYQQLSLQSLNKEIFFYLIFFALISFPNLVKKENLKFIIRLLLLTAVIAALIGTVKVLIGMNVRASSTTSGYYTLGMYLSVIFTMILVLGKNKEIMSSRIVWGIILILLMIGILFTQNRIHWLTIGFFILVIGVVRERLLLTITILILIGVIIISPALSERFSQLIHFTQNYSDRDVLWRGAFKIWDTHPVFGFGTRTFKEIFPLVNELTDKGINGWHCDYIQVYMEGGIIGFLSFIWLVISIFYFGIKNIKRFKENKFYFDINFSVLTGLSVLFITAFVGGFFLDPICSILFQVLLAILALLINLKVESD